MAIVVEDREKTYWQVKLLLEWPWLEKERGERSGSSEAQLTRREIKLPRACTEPKPSARRCLI